MTQEELDAVVDEAHAFGNPVAVHCFTPDAQRMCRQAHVDTIEHMVYTDEDAIARIKDSGTYVVPTLLHRSDRAIELRKAHGESESLVRKMKEVQPACFDTFRNPDEDIRVLQAKEKIKLVVKDGDVYVDRLSREQKY